MGKKLSPVKLEGYKPLRDIVLDAIREAIVNGQLNPGERLMEQQLAEDLGVSRTPIREAIRKLELEGFVLMLPRKGAYVADISIRDIAEVFEVRSAMEALAAGLAAQRITEEGLELLERNLVGYKEAGDELEQIIENDTGFHEIIYNASRNNKLILILNNIRDQIQRYRTASLAHPGRYIKTLDEHKGIVEAISARNVELAQRLAKEHIENAENIIIEGFREESKKQLFGE